MKVQRLHADAGMRLPDAGAADAKWCALFPMGKWSHHTGGDIDFTRELAAEFIASWKAAGSPPLPITLHHVPDDLPVTEKRTAGEAEGWIEDLRIGSGDMALEGAVKWTSAGKALIDGDRYRYLSPEWSMQHTDRRTGGIGGPWLYGAALLNDPFFHTMPRVAASQQQPTNHAQPAAPVAKENHMKQRICAALRLAEDVADEKVAEAVEKLAASHVEVEAKLTASAKASAKVEALEATVTKLKAAHDETATKLAEAQAAKAEADVNGAIDTAIHEGVVVNDEFRKVLVATAKSAGMETLTSLLAHQPRGKVPGTERGIAGSNDGTVASAKAVIDAAAEKFRTAGMSAFDARLRAMESNPSAALLYASASTTTQKES